MTHLVRPFALENMMRKRFIGAAVYTAVISAAGFPSASMAQVEELPLNYVIASDRTLRHLAVLRPDSPATLELVHGIGPAKAERYGEALLAIVKQRSGMERDAQR